MRDNNILGQSHVLECETPSVLMLGEIWMGRKFTLHSIPSLMESKTSFICKYLVVMQCHLAALLRRVKYVRCFKPLTGRVNYNVLIAI